MLRVGKSHLLPTITMGTSSASFTLLICSLYWVMSSKDFALFTANTIKKPSPVLRSHNKQLVHKKIFINVLII